MLRLPIKEAVRKGDFEKLEILVSNPTCIVDQVTPGSNTTALMIAIERGMKIFRMCPFPDFLLNYSDLLTMTGVRNTLGQWEECVIVV